MENEITLEQKINDLSTNFNYGLKRTVIILSAGHGKRIKSSTSKMLHQIWGKATVERVYNACVSGLSNFNSRIVVGIKALEVMELFGKKGYNSFAYQAEQKGTGHAVQIGLRDIDAEKYDGTVLVLPGDMGLIDSETIKMFVEKFENSNSDMMVLTGLYEGEFEKNSYGRIIRVPKTDAEGNSSGDDFEKVIEIIEHKDIFILNENETHDVNFNNRKYSFAKKELLENNEFNSGVFAFDFKNLHKLIFQINSNNAQGEVYLTDMISLFNKNNLTVGAVSPAKQYVIMGFNDKTVLKQMNSIARKLVYDRLKNIVEIVDPEDFYISDNVVEQILEADKNGTLLDMFVGKGVYLGEHVKINTNLTLMRDVCVNGNVVFGENVTVMENAHISCYEGQKLIIGDSSEIFWGNIIKGNTVIGSNCKIESSVNMTGSDEFPLCIGNNVIVKGTSYIFGSSIDNNIFIEHSVLVKKEIKNNTEGKNSVIKIRYVFPKPQGEEFIETII